MKTLHIDHDTDLNFEAPHTMPDGSIQVSVSLRFNPKFNGFLNHMGRAQTQQGALLDLCRRMEIENSDVKVIIN